MNTEIQIFWDVTSLTAFEAFFKSGITNNDTFHRTYDLVKNLSYNAQYLEFLSNAISKDIHTVIEKELTKTFVVTGMSVVESILYYVLKSEKLNKTIAYEEIATIKSNQKKVEGVDMKVETTIYKKLKNNKEVKMNLDSMLKKTEKKKLFGEDLDVYKQLNHLRKLRNKIHLYLIEEDLDHDFNNFTIVELNLMKTSLFTIFSSDKFSVSLDEKNRLFNFLKV